MPIRSATVPLLTLLALAACSENHLVKTGDNGGTAFQDVTPNIVVTPPAVDFGTVQAGSSAAATVSIANTGDDTLTLDALQIAGDDGSIAFTTVSSILAAGESVDTVLTWSPITGGAMSQTLDVGSNDPDTPVVTVPLTGNVPVGNLTVTPASYDFGTVNTGTEQTMTLTVANDGAGPITVSGVAYTAGDPDLHVLDAGGLTVLPATLDAGTSTSVVIEYTPTDAASDDGNFTVTSDDPDEPVIAAEQYGNAVSADPCNGLTKHVELLLTADDAWQGYMDGTEFFGPNSSTWSASDTLDWDLPCGDHTLGIYATDVSAAVSGVIAVVWIDGAVRFVSGPTDWTIVDTRPAADWNTVGFDDSAWNIPQVCASSAIWGTSPQPFYDQGAQWIWWTSSCGDLGEAWLRLNFSVP